MPFQTPQTIKTQQQHMILTFSMPINQMTNSRPTLPSTPKTSPMMLPSTLFIKPLRQY